MKLILASLLISQQIFASSLLDLECKNRGTINGSLKVNAHYNSETYELIGAKVTGDEYGAKYTSYKPDDYDLILSWERRDWIFNFTYGAYGPIPHVRYNLDLIIPNELFRTDTDTPVTGAVLRAELKEEHGGNGGASNFSLVCILKEQ